MTYTDDNEESPVRCPFCQQVPPKGAHWMCSDMGRPGGSMGCGHVFDTFATNATCPRCGKVFRYTQCLFCHKWSPIQNYYNA